MIPPDREIFEVESRLAQRRAHFARQLRETGEHARQALALPLALAAAAAGFVAAGAVARRGRRPAHPERRRGSDPVKAATRTGLAGMLLPAALWLVRAQWGSPARAAQVLLEKFHQEKGAVSPRGDMTRS